MVSKWISLIIISLSLFGCLQKEEVVAPEESAILFFEALYNEKNYQKALTFVSSNLKKDLVKYKTAKHASRQYFYLSFDKVQIDAALADKSLRADFFSNGNLTVLFDGTFNGQRIKELRKVKMKQVGEKWVIDKIYKA